MEEKDKLLELEGKCIQECAPPCAAACPVHVDARGIAAHMVRGNFEAALKLLRKTVPFPAIIGSTCDQPCQICNRSRAGGAIEIAALERACGKYGETAPPRIGLLPARKERVAVVGGGLSGLTAAYDLRRKGYAVTIFEAGDRLGGALRRFPEERLPAERIDRELAVLLSMGVEIELNRKVDMFNLPDFEAVYAALGDATGSGGLSVDPLTCATEQEGLFAGGTMLRGVANYSSILSLADGRRAAVSIDRYLQQASLTAARSGEGSFQSCLYTNMDNITPVSPCIPTTPDGGFTAEEAQKEATRCLQCQCLECVKVCRYLESFGAYPRKYVREIHNNLSIVMGTRQSNLLINSCSFCGLCAEVCPNNLNMAEVCSDARRTMVRQRHMPPGAHDFALQDMLFANSDACTIARNAPGTTISDYLFFPGCQLSASAPAHVEKTYQLLRDRLPGGAVGLMLGCCGAPADWAGRDDLLQQALADLVEKWQQLGNPQVILACPSCIRLFRNRLPEIAIRSLWELLAEEGRLPMPAGTANNQVLAIHDPCATRYETKIQDSVRDITLTLGYGIDELRLSRRKTTCCSYGGLQWFANRRIARETITRRIGESDCDYLTYCTMCRDLFATQGKRCLHLLDLLLETDIADRAIRPCPDWSQRRANRVQLRKNLLTELWGEVTEGSPDTLEIKLSVVPEIRAILEERFILDDDIRQVIARAETRGPKLKHVMEDRFLDYHTLGKATYWVEYSRANEGVTVIAAYSHRMEIAAGKIVAGGKADPVNIPPWHCASCGTPLEPGIVEIAYLGSSFPVDLYCCPRCGIVFIPEELALTRMAEAERMLEDK